MQAFLPELVFHQDEPIADPVCIPLYYVSKLARETGTSGVQGGDGSDESLAGDDCLRTYLQIEEKFWRYAERPPRAARRAAAAIARPLAQKTLKQQTAAELIRRLRADQ